MPLDGIDDQIRKAPLWLRRAAVVLLLVPALAIEFFHRIWKEVRHLPIYWRADFIEQIEDARRLWRRR